MGLGNGMALTPGRTGRRGCRGARRADGRRRSPPGPATGSSPGVTSRDSTRMRGSQSASARSTSRWIKARVAVVLGFIRKRRRPQPKPGASAARPGSVSSTIRIDWRTFSGPSA